MIPVCSEWPDVCGRGLQQVGGRGAPSTMNFQLDVLDECSQGNQTLSSCMHDAHY